jgi:hypothetical protein
MKFIAYFLDKNWAIFRVNYNWKGNSWNVEDFCRGPGLPDFSGHTIPKRDKKYTKLPQNYPMTIKIPNGNNIFQVAIEYTKLFDSKALQILPKLGFLVWKYTIWQPCPGQLFNTLSMVTPKRSITIAKLISRSHPNLPAHIGMHKTCHRCNWLVNKWPAPEMLEPILRSWFTTPAK